MMVRIAESKDLCGSGDNNYAKCERTDATFTTPQGWADLDGSKFACLTPQNVTWK